jgi:TRAP-type uncharacterized transport system substrate-binding protein
MAKGLNLRIATTGQDRSEIAARIVISMYDIVRGSPTQVAMVLGGSDSELGGVSAPLVVGNKKYHFAFANPAALARVALLGRGFYKKKIPLRAIGVFPSWDRLVFAVRKETGIHSLAEIKEKKYPLRVSSRQGGNFHSTLFAIDQVLNEYGFSLKDIEKWGGKIFRESSPRTPGRMAQIEKGQADAVFDEGIKGWGALALKSGMRFLPINEKVLKRVEGLGFSRALITPLYYPDLEEEVPTVDFSGWLFFCHRELPARIAYQIAMKIDQVRDQLPSDHFDRRPMTMEEFCRGSEAGPLSIPLHLGAKKYYREKGYL